jgi:predicted secreted protein
LITAPLFLFYPIQLYSQNSENQATESTAKEKPEMNNAMKSVFGQAKKELKRNEDIMSIIMIILVFGMVLFALFLALRTKTNEGKRSINIKKKIGAHNATHHARGQAHQHPRR